jgi:hypothetical protein
MPLCAATTNSAQRAFSRAFSKAPNIRSQIESITEMLRGSQREVAKEPDVDRQAIATVRDHVHGRDGNAPTANARGWIGNGMP